MNTEQYYIIDTYAWIEYFLSSKKGGIAKQYIENGFGVTPSIVLWEIKRKYLGEIEKGNVKSDVVAVNLSYIKSRTQILNLDGSIAEKCAEIDFQMKKKHKDWPMADSVLIAASELLNAKIVTGDPHFKGIKNVVFLG